MSASTGQWSSKRTASRSAVCSQSVSQSSLLWRHRLSCPAFYPGQGQHLGGWKERGGGGGATALIHNHFKQMRKPASSTVPFLFSLRKSLYCEKQVICFSPEVFIILFSFSFSFFFWLYTPGKTYIPFLSHDLCCLPLMWTVKHFVTRSNQLHYCPVNQLGDRFLTPSLPFLLSGHMGQIKGAFPFFFYSCWFESSSSRKHRAGCRSVGRVSPDEAWETFWSPVLIFQWNTLSDLCRLI